MATITVNIGVVATTVGGTVDAITATFSPTVTSLLKKIFIFKATGANNSTAPTFKADATAAKTIVKKGNQALVAGDIPNSSFYGLLVYDATNDNYELLNPASDATDTIWQENGGVVTLQTILNVLRLGGDTNWGISTLEIYSEEGSFPLFIGDAGGADGLLYIEHVAGAFNVTSTIDLDFTSSLIKVLTQVAGANNNDAASTEYVDRVNAQSVVSAATVTPTQANDLVVITAQAVGLTLANPTGTWQQGQALAVRIKDDGTSRTIAYGAGYRAIGTTLPTATTANKIIYLFIVYNSTDSKWDVTGVSEEA